MSSPADIGREKYTSEGMEKLMADFNVQYQSSI
jgi:hypothetical protein